MGKMSLLLALLALGACATANEAALPYRAWTLGFVAPAYMEVWIETIDVEDINGRIFSRAGGGTASISYRGSAAGWPKRIGFGGGRDVTGAVLPKRIYVRWQSLVEPQTYKAILEIPESTRRLMQTKAPSLRDPNHVEYRKVLVLGLAPRGQIKAWVTGPVGAPIEVLCQKAEIEQRGPDLGLFEGRYVTLPAESKEYLRTHPIPYDSWKCR
jgi:hypothetical protein